MPAVVATIIVVNLLQWSPAARAAVASPRQTLSERTPPPPPQPPNQTPCNSTEPPSGSSSSCTRDTTTVRCSRTPSTVAGCPDQAYSVKVDPYTCGAMETRKRKRRRWKKTKKQRPAAEDDVTPESRCGTTEAANTVMPLSAFPADGRSSRGCSHRVFEIPVGQLDLLYTVRRAATAATAVGDGGANCSKFTRPAAGRATAHVY